MKTTVVIDDQLYRMLKEASERDLETRRGVSEYLGNILRDFFARKKDGELFGSSKRFTLKGYRDEHDRFA